jgi:hypothetical protein
MKTYVLCNWHPEVQQGTFVCALVAGSVTYHPTPEPAVRFDTIAEAIAHRHAIADKLTWGAHKYRVHELLPDGQLVDFEPPSR